MSGPTKWIRAAVPAVLALAVAGAFLPVLGNGFTSWDDQRMLIDNDRYRGFATDNLEWMFSTFFMGHYQPLSWLSLAASHAIGGLDPFHFHLGNLLLHVANAVLAYLLIAMLLRRTVVGEDGGDSSWLLVSSATGAALFALHPLRVESVAWATERRDVLSTAFLLLTVICYLRAATLDRARRTWRLASLGSFALSLLAKAWGITLPVVLLVLDVYPLRRAPLRGLVGREGRQLWIEKIPYALLAGVFAVLAVRAQHAWAMDVVVGHGIADRLGQAVYGLGFYLATTVWPVGLHPIYVLPPDFSGFSPLVLAAGVLVAALGGWAVAVRRSRPWAPAALAIYAIVVSPVLGFAQSGRQIAADRYTYVALLPLAAVAAGAFYSWGVAAGRRRRAMLTSGAVAVLAVLGVLTWRQSGIWRDDSTLWAHVLRHDPDNFVALGKRGLLRQRAGDLVGAAADFSAAIAADPGYWPAYVNRGGLRWQLGDLAAAESDYRTAVELRPGSAVNHLLLGDLLAAKGRPREAVEELSRAIDLDPSLAPARTSRGLARRELGDLAGAHADLSAAVGLDPENPGTLANRGSLRLERGDLAGAASDLARALAVAPADWQHRAQIEGLLAGLSERREAAGARTGS